MKLIRRPFRLFNSSEIFLLNLFTVLSNKKPIVIRGINLSQKLSWEKYCHQLNYHYYCKLHLVQKKRRSDFQGIDQDSSIRDIWAPLLLQMHQMYSYKLSSSLWKRSRDHWGIPTHLTPEKIHMLKQIEKAETYSCQNSHSWHSVIQMKGDSQLHPGDRPSKHLALKSIGLASTIPNKDFIKQWGSP